MIEPKKCADCYWFDGKTEHWDGFKCTLHNMTVRGDEQSGWCEDHAAIVKKEVINERPF